MGVKRADPAGAPSRIAVNLLADIKKNEKLRREFWRVLLTARLAKAVRKAKGSPFEGDDDPADEPETQKSFVERYFGGGDHAVP